MTTPNIGLTELANAQSQYLNANNTFAIIDAILQTRAINKTLTSAPGSPVDGDVYIMASAWAGVTLFSGGACAAGDIAVYRSGIGAFKAIRPKEGWKMELASDDTTYRFDGSAWQVWSAGGGGGSSNATQSVSSSAGVLNLSATTAPVILVTLTENITSVTMPSGTASQSVERRIVFTQAAGNYTIPTSTAAWGGISVEGGASIPQVGTGAGTVGIYVLANDDNTGWRMYIEAGITTAQVGQLSGFRNLLINGNFAINQRAYVSATATTGANQYTLDRWRVVTSGQNLSFSASGNGNQITAPAGGVEQVIEGANIGGGTYTLNWTGTATATVNGTPIAKGKAFTLPANTNAIVRLIGGTASLVQLEPGSLATPFEYRSRTAELHLCQRYWHRATFYVGTPTLPVQTFYPAEMRAAPTVTGGGAGFSAGGQADRNRKLICSQTTAADQTLSFDAEL